MDDGGERQENITRKKKVRKEKSKRGTMNEQSFKQNTFRDCFM